jgi:hypothetical protein
LAKEETVVNTIIAIPSPMRGSACMLSSFRLDDSEVAVLAAVPADLEAGAQAEAAGAEETDQGPAQAGAEDPDPGFWKI